jgi:hypothetical protein
MRKPFLTAALPTDGGQQESGREKQDELVIPAERPAFVEVEPEESGKDDGDEYTDGTRGPDIYAKRPRINLGIRNQHSMRVNKLLENTNNVGDKSAPAAPEGHRQMKQFTRLYSLEQGGHPGLDKVGQNAAIHERWYRQSDQAKVIKVMVKASLFHPATLQANAAIPWRIAKPSGRAKSRQ